MKLLPWAVLCAFAGHAYAQSVSSPIITLGDVKVSDKAEGPLLSNNILTSVDVMSGEQVHDKNVLNSWELMGQMPGIQLTEFRLGAESGKPSFRAFNGEGYINGIKLLIDGIPSNVNSGNLRFMDMIFPLDIEYIEVVRGTNDPRYGLHNIGGNIGIGTRQGGNYTDVRTTYGSFNTREIQTAIGRESEGFSQNYFLAKQDSDGHREHSRSDKYSAGGKWFFSSSNGDIKAGLIARVYSHDSQEPGYLTASELAADRNQSPAKNANDRGSRDMQHLSAHLDYRFNPDTLLSTKLYYNEISDDRRVTYTSNPAGTAPRQRRIWDEEQVGFLSTLTWNVNSVVTLDGGFNIERQDNKYRRYRYSFSSPTDFSTPTTTSNDDIYSFNNIGAYVQAIIRPSEKWKIIPAFRMDKFSGSTHLRNLDQTAKLQDYGWVNQPKLSVVFSPTAKSSIYANWGKTFQVLTGSRGSAYLTSGTDEFAPSMNTGKEIGVKFQPFPKTDMRLAVWRQDATDEVANLPSANVTLSLGETRRKGIDFEVVSAITDELKVWFSHSIQEARIVGGYSVGTTSLSGKEVFSTPRYITNIGVEYRPSEDWKFGMQGRASGDYYIDELNEKGKFGGYILFDSNVRYNLSKTTSLDFQIKNMFDRKYEYVWYDSFFWPSGSHQPMFSPGPGRAAYLSLNMKF